MEFEAVKVCDDIAIHWLVAVAEDMLAPSVGICDSKIAAGDLLQHMGHMQGFQHREISWFQAVLVTNVLDELGPGKGPLVRAYRQKEEWKTILPDGINQQ